MVHWHTFLISWVIVLSIEHSYCTIIIWIMHLRNYICSEFFIYNTRQIRPMMCGIPTCWERERGMVGIVTGAPGVAPPREKVMLWEALIAVCGLGTWWLTPPIRSKSSAEGGIGGRFEVVVEWVLPNRSVTGWEGPALEEVDGWAEKAFQSPNSPFPLDDAAADHKTAMIMFSCICSIHLEFLSFTMS